MSHDDEVPFVGALPKRDVAGSTPVARSTISPNGISLRPSRSRLWALRTTTVQMTSPDRNLFAGIAVKGIGWKRR
jgi:hypothetical protein